MEIGVALLLLAAGALMTATWRRLRIPQRALARSWNAGEDDMPPDAGVREPAPRQPGSGSGSSAMPL